MFVKSTERSIKQQNTEVHIEFTPDEQYSY